MNELPLIGAVHDMPGIDGLRYAVLARRRASDEGASQATISVFDAEMRQVALLRWEVHTMRGFLRDHPEAHLSPDELGMVRGFEVREDWKGRRLDTVLSALAAEVGREMGWPSPKLPLPA